MNTDSHFDLVVVGSGPGGTRAAFLGAQSGMKTAIVESGFLGGTCLNVGCVPTKFLLGGTASLPLFAAQRKYKVADGEIRINLEALQERKNRFIQGTRQALEKNLEKAGAVLIRGKASFAGPQLLKVSGGAFSGELSFNKCIVATGSAPAVFPGLRPDGATVRSSSGVLDLKTPPRSMLIVGGGAIGLEIGELFHRLGCRILLVEGMPRILPGEDEDVSAAMHSHFTRDGWQIHTGRRIASVGTVEGRSKLVFEDGESLEAESAMLAVGRRSLCASLKPEAAGLPVNRRGWLETDENLRCSEHVYAVGDINGRIQLAHAADNQARHAVRHAAGQCRDGYKPPAMPGCIYGSMEVMRVGPTAAQLLKSANEVQISQAPLSGNAIAQSYGHIQGFARAIWADGELRSLAAVGHGVSQLLGTASMLVAAKLKKNQEPPIIFAHPTLDEVLESAIVAPMRSIKL